MQLKFLVLPDGSNHQRFLARTAEMDDVFSKSGLGMVPNGILRSRIALSDNLDENIGTLTFEHECYRHSQSVKGDRF
jgi:hypothetical protein